MSLADLGAGEAARRVAAGEIRSADLVDACLERIDEREPEVQAWQHLDADLARLQAEACDRVRESGGALGPLHGVPVGIKDIFDTRDLPTENGTVIDAGRQPTDDCAAVERLRAAGAVIMGKTVSTELAVYAPGKTRNPHDPTHTPGGSSSGSAAAVAAGMVPLAIGSQTNGSMIRPASYCGVVGFKPTHGLISRRGALILSRVLDHVGVFARSVEDAGLIADALAGHDPGDPDTRTMASPRLRETAVSEPPLDPRLAFVKTPVWDQADPETHDAFAEVVEALGEACAEEPLAAPFERAHDMHRTIMNADLARYLKPYHEGGRERLSETILGLIDDGKTRLAVDYNEARDWIDVFNTGLEKIFETFDAILTPAAPGPAPAGLEATGSPVFCTMWTLFGTPAVSVPVLAGASGLPMGLQLVGRRGDDARLLRTANWLVRRLTEDDAD